MVEDHRFLANRDVIIASSYRQESHLADLRRVSRFFEQHGQTVYPPPNTQAINIDDDFVYLSGMGQEDMKKIKIERLFLEGIKNAKLLYVVTTNGYAGQSVSTEILYGLAVGTPTLVSQQITAFGESVPDNIRQLVKANHPYIVPIDLVEKLGLGILDLAEIEQPKLDNRAKQTVFRSLHSLSKTLKD